MKMLQWLSGLLWNIFKMKAIILCFALIAIAAVNCETTADLLRAQNELSIAHEYAELQLQINRNIISSYIEIVQSQIIDSFMDSYEEIHFIQEWVQKF